MSVGVVTDSAASPPSGAAERLGIVVDPMTLVLGRRTRLGAGSTWS